MLLEKWNKQLKKPISLLLLGLLILAGAVVQPAYAASLTVDSTADSMADDGVCTLREAITNANNDDQSGSVDCVAGDGPDTITFSVDGTITLGSALPEISSEMTIDGAGHSVTVSGDNAYRVMVVNASGTLDLNALTIADGFIDDSNEHGGGILNNGTLLISNSTFTGNNAASQGGGAINNRNSATISNSTFTGNSAGTGGGIYNYAGPLTINNSTIANNSGGGISLLYGTVTVQNSIVANNSGNSDCYKLGSGNTLIADGSNMDSDGTCDNATTQTAVQLNLGTLADNGGETQTMALLPGSTAIDATTTGTATDQRGVARPQGAAFDIGAFEAEVAVQPGPTFTVNSLDDHDDSYCTPDDCTLREAINAANMVNGADVIIFSVSGTITLGSNLPVITSEMTIDGAGQAITVSGDYGSRPMAVYNNAMLNLNAMTIANGVSDYGGGIQNYGTLNVSNSTFFDNNASSGGAIFNTSTLNISNSTFSGNSVTYDGSGIYNAGTLNINNSTFSGNSSRPSYPSSSILNINGTTTLQNSIIANSLNGSDCINAGSGSTLNADSSNMDSDGTCGDATTQTAVQLNLGTLADNGGDTQTIALLPGSTAIDAATTGPATDQRGVARPQQTAYDVGAYEAELVCPTFPVTVSDEAELNEAIACYNALTTPGSYTLNLGADIDLTASSTTIDNAMAGVDLLIDGAGFTIDGQDLSGVRVFVIAANTVVTMDHITITGANASGFGGGIFNSGNLTLVNSAVLNNVASDGGGIHNELFAVAVVRNTTLSGNTGETGGAIHNDGNLTLIHTTMSGNIGSIASLANFGQAQVQNSIFANSIQGGHCFNWATVTSQGYNLSDDDSCDFLSASGDLTQVDPLLGPLADNGGDTETFSLLTGSPAIDHIPTGVNGCGTDVTTDQRGVSRPQGAGCDIGAFELEFTNHLPVIINDSYSTDEGTQLDVAAPGVLDNDSDADGDVLTAVLVDDASNGDLTLNPDGSFSYLPDAGFSGDDSFTYVANDGTGDSDLATVTITVEMLATGPTCQGVPATIVGTDGNDILIGTDGDDVIVGLKGDDIIRGTGGNDLICGGLGDDWLVGGAGDDKLHGGPGWDTLFGNIGDDELHGGFGDDWLYGGFGNDLLYGKRGWDVLYGGPGADEMYGGPGQDWLIGDGGNDALDGGLGDGDTCQGGADTDTAVNCEAVYGVP